MSKDKILHFVAGIGVTLFFSIILSPIWGVLFGIAFGIGKELIWDKWLKKGTPELLDFLATALGSLLTFALLLVFTRV
ncbi:MAG: hypothetical protein QM445_04280 [Thermotogota bacterium]|jgi:hypothetical protein|nr:hypothetical protein [Thermotogota bacterium]